MRSIRLGGLYRRFFRDVRRERQFIASGSFFLTFVVARIVTHSIRDGGGFFNEFWVGDTHVHHLVWGILLLLAAGYAWLVQVGTGADPEARHASRIISALFGVGAALTLDEFALWLNLEDVYWEREGRASIDAVVIFGALVSMGLWGGPFFRAVVKRVARVLGRRSALPGVEDLAHRPGQRGRDVGLRQEGDASRQ